MSTTTKCQFCDLDAHAPDSTDPPMCEKHQIIAQAISRLKHWKWSVTVIAVQNFVYFNNISGVALHEIPDLCATMPEFQNAAQD